MLLLYVATVLAFRLITYSFHLFINYCITNNTRESKKRRKHGRALWKNALHGPIRYLFPAVRTTAGLLQEAALLIYFSLF